MSSRICSTCKHEYPLTPEYWHRNHADFHFVCKQCACIRSREWYHSDKERELRNHKKSNEVRSAKRAEKRRIKEAAYIAPTHRVCNVCQVEFPRTAEFWPKQSRRTDGLDETCKACTKKRAKDWYLANRERASIANKEYREQNPEQVIERRRRYKEANGDKIRAANLDFYARNREKRIAETAQWRKDNPDKRAAQWRREYENNIDRIKQRAKEWFDANPERAKVSRERRRAIRRGAPGHFTRADLLAQFEKQQGKCFYCREDLQNMGTVDHYVPLSKGGTNYPDNIVLACWPCNNRKRAKLPSDFRS